MPTSSPSPVTRAPKPKWKRVLSWCCYSLLAFCALSVGILAGWIQKSPIAWQVLKANVGEAVGIKQPAAKDIFQSSEMTLLVLGCDEDRYYGGKQILNKQARSDMMMIAKLDFVKNRIGAISIPRDLYVDLPGYSGHKINAFHAIGGPELAKEAVEYKIGIPIDRVVVLNFNAFQEMVDLVGGINMYVPKTMKYTDKAGGLFIDLKQGRQTLNGYNAMCFVRFRHSDSDFARAERQRDFMLSFKQSILSNPAQLPAVVEKASEVMGGGFSQDEIAALSVYMRRVKSDNIKMGALPVVERSRRTYTLDPDLEKMDEALVEHYLKPGNLTSASTTSGQGANL